MEFEVNWSASGTAIVDDVDSQAEAERKVQTELLRWSGLSVDMTVDVEAVDT